MTGVSRKWVVSLVLVFVAGCKAPPQVTVSGSLASAAPETSTTPPPLGSPSSSIPTLPAQHASRTATPPARPDAPSLDHPQPTYPRARWRLADTDTVDRAVLWFSHILLRHADSRETVSFSLGFWSSVPPRPTRSRAEALVLAQRVAEQAAADPTQFTDLARRYSEDLPSREEGGFVGGYPTNLLTLWPQVLDALAALRPGQSSRVVETRYGFHVFYRCAAPFERTLSGEHILIGHANAPWGQVFARDRPTTRSRADALALAKDVYRQASAEPSRFRELVERYSEHHDVVVGGDFGTWSTREPSAFPARMKRLRELEVGEVAAPIETHLGFEIVRRTVERQRQQYRARMLVFPFDEFNSEAPQDDPVARANALAKASSAARVLARDPTRFEQLGAAQMERQWEDGRELPTLSFELQRVELSQITQQPVRSEYGYLVALRLAPEAVQRAEYLTDLPSPAQAAIDQFFIHLPASDGVAFLRLLAKETELSLALTGATAARLRALHDLEGRLEDDGLALPRVSRLNSTLDGTRQLLGEKRYERYRKLLDRHASAWILEPAPDSLAELGF